MRFKKESVVWLTYLLLIVALIVTSRTVANEWRAEAQLQQEKIDLLLEDLKSLKHEKDSLEEILLRDKQKINELLQEIEELKIIRARVTAYAPAENTSGICADDDPAVTATGTKPVIGTLAADFSKLPPGTELFVPGYGIGRIEDTGALLRRGRGLRLDVVMRTHEEAIEWGVQELDVVLQR